MLRKLRIEIKWVIIYHLLGLLWVYFEHAMELDQYNVELHILFTNLYIIPSIIIFCLAFMDKRNNYYMHHMSFKEVIFFGLSMTAMITLLTPITQSINSLFITPEFFDRAIDHFVAENEMTSTQAKAYFTLNNYIKVSMQGAFKLFLILTTLITIISYYIDRPSHIKH